MLLVRQLRVGFTKNAKVSPNLTVAHIQYKTNTCHEQPACCYIDLYLLFEQQGIMGMIVQIAYVCVQHIAATCSYSSIAKSTVLGLRVTVRLFKITVVCTFRYRWSERCVSICQKCTYNMLPLPVRLSRF